MNSILGTGLTYALYVRKPGAAWERCGELEHNLMPQEAVDHVAGLIRGSGPTPISSWYVGIFENNYVPTSAVTAADLPGVVGECVAYDEATRPQWVTQYDDVSVIDNTLNLATFTMNAAKRVYGAFIVSNSIKTGNTGLLLSIARFSTPRDLEPGMEFGVGAVLTLIPTSI